MDKIAYSCYTLKSIDPLNSLCETKNHEGLLLRVENDSGSIGYSAYHPWVFLGDLCCEEQLLRYKVGLPTERFNRTLAWAIFDANSFWIGKAPYTQRLILDCLTIDNEELEGLLAEGVSHVKVKIGRFATQEALKLKALLSTVVGKQLIWRLDANANFTVADFNNFLRTMGEEALHHIDFIEDPTTFCLDTWESWQKNYAISLAADYCAMQALGEFKAAKVLILKPVLLSFKELLNALEAPQRCVITSYMDHPLGVAIAARMAARLYELYPHKEEVCGLSTHLCYLPDHFSSLLKVDGSSLSLPEGKGWGFSRLLEQLNWTYL